MAAERVIDGIQFKLHLSHCHPNFAIQIHPFASPVAPTWFNAALCFQHFQSQKYEEDHLAGTPTFALPGSQLRTSKDFFMEFSHEMPDPKIATWTGGFQPAKKRGVVLVNA